MGWQRRCSPMESFHASNTPEILMKTKTLVAALALTMAGLAMAQPATPNLDKREANQQQRIDQGVASGQLTAKETNRLQKREAKLAADEAAAKADGTVTRAERRKQGHPPAETRRTNRSASWKISPAPTHARPTTHPSAATGTSAGRCPDPEPSGHHAYPARGCGHG